jgi:hypothetical protein
MIYRGTGHPSFNNIFRGNEMIKINRLLVLFALSLLSPAYGGSVEPSSQGPKAHCAQKVFEFRPVVEGTEVVHEFVLQNQGDAPLAILKIESG